MATKAMKAAAMRVSGNVTDRRETTSEPTGTSYWIERPRSPRNARPIHSTYWTTSGRLRPSDSRMRSTASGLPSVPTMTRAGSPGRTRTTMKTSRDTKRRVTASVATLLRTNRRNGRPRGPAYFCQATSERSSTGSGRSFQSPVTPFLVTTSRGCM